MWVQELAHSNLRGLYKEATRRKSGMICTVGSVQSGDCCLDAIIFDTSNLLFQNVLAVDIIAITIRIEAVMQIYLIVESWKRERKRK